LAVIFARVYVTVKGDEDAAIVEVAAYNLSGSAD
jgi:hypothetical protein